VKSIHLMLKNEKFIKDLLLDLGDQVTMGLTNKTYYNKWGKHFLPSLVRAHLLQQCNNFKDPGVQNYGGEIFNQVRDVLDDLFVKLPPPKPSIAKPANNPAPQVSNMQVFYNQYGGCFAGSCLVTMANGNTKLVQDIRKDDEVMGPDGRAVKVSCVIRTLCGNKKPHMVQFEDGLVITPYHPIRMNGRFLFPCSVEEAQEYDCSTIYNFVLDTQHIMKINGIECVTLAHGFQEDVVRHPYFGTTAIINDLQVLHGWEDGLVELTGDYVRRDPKTGLVMGLTKNTTEEITQNLELLDSNRILI